MKRSLIIPLAAALIFSLTPFSAEAVSVSAPEAGVVLAFSTESTYAERVALLVNQERRKAGMAEVKVLPTLNRAAAVRAQEISVNFGHNRPDGTSIGHLVDTYNIEWRKIGENIAAGQTSPESAMDSWMNSSGHRSNILNPEYEYIGVACYRSNDTYYWVQIFVKSASNIEVGAYLPRNYGDVNDNGIIDAVDASLVLTDYAMCSVGKASSFDEYHQDIADMTRDGIVNGVDATSILTYYAKSSVR